MFKVSLEAARVNARMSQKEVAKRLNVNVATISNWEHGKTSPNCIQFGKLCELYHCPIDAIFLPS